MVCQLVAHIDKVTQTLWSDGAWQHNHGSNIVILLSCLSRLASSSAVSAAASRVVGWCKQNFTSDQALAFGLAQQWLKGAGHGECWSCKSASDPLDEIGHLRDARVSNVNISVCTDILVMNYLAHLASGRVQQTRCWVNKGFEEMRERSSVLHEPLKFNGAIVDRSSSLRVYFVTHIVLMATAYGTQHPPDETMGQWQTVAALLCQWVTCIGQTDLHIQKNFELFFETSYCLMYMFRLSSNLTLQTARETFFRSVLRVITRARHLIDRLSEGRDIANIPVQNKSKFQNHEGNVFLVHLSTTNNATIADYHAHVILAFFLVEFQRVVNGMGSSLRTLYLNTKKELRPSILGLCVLLDENSFDILHLPIDDISNDENLDRAFEIMLAYLKSNLATQRGASRIEGLIISKLSNNHRLCRANVESTVPIMSGLPALLIGAYAAEDTGTLRTPCVTQADYLTTPQ